MVSGLTLVAGVAGVLVVGGVVAYSVMVYNSLVRLRRNIEEAWSNIDVLLKQRSDELPKLIDTAQEYMEYERDVLQRITEARTAVQQAGGPEEAAQADENLRGALGELFAVAEDYPELRSNENFQQLQGRISSLEEQIADRREFYNESVNTYNIRTNQIPYNVFANMMGYQDKELFEASEEERADVDITAEFGQGSQGTQGSQESRSG
jgi:LemA protein